MPAQDVRPSDLIAIAERASKKSHHVARLVFGVQNPIFVHGLGRHVVESDPVSQIKTSALLGPRPTARGHLSAMIVYQPAKSVGRRQIKASPSSLFCNQRLKKRGPESPLTAPNI